MYRSLTLLLSSLLCAFAGMTAGAQERAARFDHIGLGEGLSQRQIFDIEQDGRGYIWLATQSGLVRYDGYEFTFHTHDPSQPTTISDNFVIALLADGDSHLWIGTEIGTVDRLDIGTGIAVRFHITGAGAEPGPVQSIQRDRAGNIWVCAEGIPPCRADIANRRLLAAPIVANIPLPDEAFAVQFLHRGSGEEWLSIRNFGPARYDSRSGAIERALQNYDLARMGDAVLHEFRDGVLFVGTWGSGLLRFDEPAGLLVPVGFQADADVVSALRYVQDIAEDGAGALWLATPDAGLFRYDPANGVLQQFRNNPADSLSLASDHVACLFVDRSQTLWAGTINGLSKYNRYKFKFRYVGFGPGGDRIEAPNYVLAICPEEEGVLWIGTMLGGVIRIDRATGETRSYDIGRAGTPIENTAYSLCIDTAGDLYVGTADKGLLRLRRGAQNFEYLSQPMHVAAILEDSSGQLWLATTVFGLCSFDRANGDLTVWGFDMGGTPERGAYDATALIEDRNGALWIGTDGNGLIRLAPDRRSFTRHRHDRDRDNSLSDDRILSLGEDASGAIWIGTRRGLNRFAPGSQGIERIQAGVLRETDVIFGILHDAVGNLWLGSNRGLIRYRPADGSGRVHTQHDGLLDLEFNQGAAARTRTGECFFGGGAGLYSFIPERMEENPHVPPVVITSFRRLGEPVAFPAGIESVRRIDLQPQENYFSFEFAALDFAETRANRFAYMLEGADTDWVQAGNRRSASYIQVPPGSYTFRVRGSNNDGLWNDKGVGVRVVIHPPFWLTWEFRIGAGILAVALLVTFYRVRTSGIKRQRNLLQKEVDERRAAEAQLLENQDRLRSLAAQLSLAEERERRRISIALHDQIGHALSLSQIKLAALAAVNAAEPLHSELQETIRLISEATDNTRSLTVDISPPTLYEFGFVAAAENLVERFGKKYKMVTTFEKPEERLPMSDEISVTLYQILRELVVNVIKHAHADMLRVAIRKDRGRVVLRIKDNGVGFDAEALLAPANRKGLGLYSIRERLESMGGKLGITSRPGKGTEIKVTAPLE